MSKIAKEKKKKSTKDNHSFSLDDEIILGLKTQPKQANSKVQTKKKTASSHKKKSNSQNKKLTKQQQLARKKRKIIFKMLKWTSILALLIAAIVYFFLSPIFQIKTITIEGNDKVSQEEILSLSQIELEQNMFQMNANEVKQQIQKNAYIDTVSVKRKLPNEVKITVTERTPSFMLTFANAYIYLNNQGYLLEVANRALNLPILVGYQTEEENLKAGNRLCKEDLQKLGDVLQIFESANSNHIANLITKINMKDKNNYILELKSEKKNVHLGDTSQLSTKMLYILKILEEEKKNEGEILVNTDLNTKGAIFREKI